MKPKPENFVKIANLKFPINMVERPVRGADAINGKIDWVDVSITLDKNLPPAITLETFLHEVVHGIDKQYGICDFTEEQTNRLAVGLAQVLVDNPETMMRFLNPCIEGD